MTTDEFSAAAELRDRRAQAAAEAGMAADRASEKAADLLVFYMRQAYKGAGLSWDEDNETEVRQIIDLLNDATEARIRAAQ